MESGVFHSTYQADMALRPTPLMRLRIIVVFVAAVVFPFLANNYYLTLANQILIASIGAIGLNILTGFTGQISLGQGGFMAIGAYGSALLVLNFGMPWWLSVIVACVITAVVGGIFGLPSLRLKGLYLAIATLAAQQIIEWAIIRSPLTGGVEALVIDPPKLMGINFSRDFNFYWLGLVLLVGTVMFAVNLFRTKVGRAFIAIRDQDIAAEVMGVNVFRYKLLAFATSSFFVGLAGALLAQYRIIVSFERFTIDTSITFLAIIIIGGLGSVTSLPSATTLRMPSTIARMVVQPCT
jgi:branched-chain amino acid transport system permease protein